MSAMQEGDRKRLSVNQATRGATTRVCVREPLRLRWRIIASMPFKVSVNEVRHQPLDREWARKTGQEERRYERERARNLGENERLRRVNIGIVPGNFNPEPTIGGWRQCLPMSRAQPRVVPGLSLGIRYERHWIEFDHKQSVQLEEISV